MPTPPAIPAPHPGLTPLDGFPWLVPAGPAMPGEGMAARKARPQGKELSPRTVVAVAVAALCAGALQLAGAPAKRPVPAAEQTLPSGSATSVSVSDALRARAGDAAQAADAGAAREAQQARIAATDERPASTPLARPAPAARTAVPATAPPPRVAPSPPAAQPIAQAPAAAAAPTPPPPVADSRASAATLREFRTALDRARDAARDVIRLETRHRPGRAASAEDLAHHRLRQQNAAAARTYRDYLDTLARSVRSAQSETLARQATERAAQTQAYLARMLADSQASLR